MRWSLDPHGAVVHTSEEWKRFTGMTDDEIVGSAARPSVHANDQEMVASTIRSAVELRTSFLVMFRSRRPCNQYDWVMAGAVPSFSPANGAFLGYLGNTELLQATPMPQTAADVLHQVPQGRHQVAMLDVIADHIMTASAIAKHADDKSLKAILDVALVSIGDLLYRAIRQ